MPQKSVSTSATVSWQGEVQCLQTGHIELYLLKPVGKWALARQAEWNIQGWWAGRWAQVTFASPDIREIAGEWACAASATLPWVYICRAIQSFKGPVGASGIADSHFLKSRSTCLQQGVLHLRPLHSLAHLLMYKTLNSPRFVIGYTNTCWSPLSSEFSSCVFNAVRVSMFLSQS